jgi:uncharacterized protein YlxW (UPF0749 family)
VRADEGGVPPEEPTVELRGTSARDGAEVTAELGRGAPPVDPPAGPPTGAAVEPAAAPAVEPAAQPADGSAGTDPGVPAAASAARTRRPADPADDGDAVDRAGSGRAGPGRAGSAGRRFSAAGAAIGLLLGLLAFALVTQLRATPEDPELAASRPEDLVRILSDLDARQERLRGEIAALEETERQLASGAQGREAALAEARRRAEQLGILAGTLPAQGPGLEVRFSAGGEPVAASLILDGVEELRGAGAEAMEITGADGVRVRIVASTYFVDAGPQLLVDGQKLTAPYTIVAIGDPRTMQTAMNIPGGVVDAVRQRGGNVTTREVDPARITTLHQAVPPRYAEPVR